MPSPAGGPGAYLQPYGGFERILLLAIALSWRPLTERITARSVGLGLLLGLLPWIKFGSAFVAGAALFAADVIVLVERREIHPRNWRKIAIGNAWILLGFLVGQITLAIYLLVTQPPTIVKDAIWPAYMLGNYAGYVTSDIRFLRWQNLGYFLGAQLPVLVAATSFLLLLWRLIGGMPRAFQDRVTGPNERVLGAFIFLFLFWFIGLSGYLAHVWLIMGYVWLPTIGAAYALYGLRPTLRLIALSVPGFPVFCNGERSPANRRSEKMSDLSCSETVKHFG